MIAHGSQKEDPLLEFLQQQLTERKFLTLRFHFPFVEAEKKRPDPAPVLLSTFRSAVTLLQSDPTAAPAHLFIGGKNVGALGGGPRRDGAPARRRPVPARLPAPQAGRPGEASRRTASSAW